MKRSEIYGRAKDGTPIMKPVAKRGRFTLRQWAKIVRKVKAER